MANNFNWNKHQFSIGDLVNVDYLIKEKGRERIQPFRGRIIAIKGKSSREKTFTVRKIAVDNIGVERIFPVNSPAIANIKFLSKPKKRIKRAKLYYLGKINGKKTKI